MVTGFTRPARRSRHPIRRPFLYAPAGAPRLRRVSDPIHLGDDGSTGLLGPGRVLKCTARIEAVGGTDELNAALGVVRTQDAHGWLTEELGVIQASLFRLGAELATSEPRALAKLERIHDADVEALERVMDRLGQALPRLTRFVVPGGSPLAAQLHLARAVCRRVERRVVALEQVEPVERRLVRYLNRLSSLLFVMARWCNQRAGVAETLWHGGTQ